MDIGIVRVVVFSIGIGMIVAASMMHPGASLSEVTLADAAMVILGGVISLGSNFFR